MRSIEQNCWKMLAALLLILIAFGWLSGPYVSLLHRISSKNYRYTSLTRSLTTIIFADNMGYTTATANCTSSSNTAVCALDTFTPLLDVKLIERTVKEWKKPLPRSYLNRPLVVVGPSGVGKGRVVKSLLRDYSRFFHKVVTHTTRPARPDEINGTSYIFVTNDKFLSLRDRVPQFRPDQLHTLIMNDYIDIIGANSSAGAPEISGPYSGQNKPSDTVPIPYFLEWAKVHRHIYGVSRTAYRAALQSRKIPILEIDIQGARSIQALVTAVAADTPAVAQEQLRPYFVFLAPPSIGKLQERLQERATESEEDIALRLANAANEIEQAQLEKGALFDAYIVNDDLEAASNMLFRLVRNK